VSKLVNQIYILVHYNLLGSRTFPSGHFPRIFLPGEKCK